MAESQGVEAARSATLDRAQRVLSNSSAAMTRGAQTPVTGLSQCFSLPTALGWATFTQVSMDAAIQQLPELTDARDIADVAETIAEGELGIGRFLPQALAVVESLDTDEGVDCSQVSEHLSDYSRFLVQAAQASEVYLQDVMGARLENPDATRMLEYVTSAVSARELSRDVTQETDDYPAEAEQFSKALTYFWLTSYVIAATQAYNLRSDPLTGDVVPNNPDSMNAAIAQTWWFIDVRNDLIKAGGLDPSAAAWSANWALQAALDNAGGEYATQAGWLAQGELWYDAVQTTAMLSYLDPTVVESPMPSDER